jgi:hypothetical protein
MESIIDWSAGVHPTVTEASRDVHQRQLRPEGPARMPSISFVQTSPFIFRP